MAPIVPISTRPSGRGFISSRVLLTPFLHHNHVLMIVMSVNVTSWCLLLAGSTTPGSMTGIYLLGLSYQPDSVLLSSGKLFNPAIQSTLSDMVTNSTSLIQAVHVGYLSLCVKLASGDWVCDSRGQAVTDMVRNSPSMDPLNLVWVADRYRRETIFLPFAFLIVIASAAVIVCLNSFPGWHSEEDSEGSTRQIKPYPGQRLQHIALGTSTMTSIIAFVSTFWLHMGGAVAIALVNSLTYGAAEAHLNVTALVFAWLGTFVATIVAIGMLVVYLSTKALEQLL